MNCGYEGCGKVLVGGGATRRYCGHDCRVAARERAGATRPTTGICLVCKKEFTQEKYGRARLYCPGGKCIVRARGTLRVRETVEAAGVGFPIRSSWMLARGGEVRRMA